MPVKFSTIKNSNKWLYHNFPPSRKILSGLSSFVCEKFSRSPSLTFSFSVCVGCTSEFLEKAGGRVRAWHRTTRAIKIYQSTKVQQKGYKNNFSRATLLTKLLQHRGKALKLKLFFFRTLLNLPTCFCNFKRLLSLSCVAIVSFRIATSLSTQGFRELL